jgi:hypothetical protein
MRINESTYLLQRLILFHQFSMSNTLSNNKSLTELSCEIIQESKTKNRPKSKDKRIFLVTPKS